MDKIATVTAHRWKRRLTRAPRDIIIEERLTRVFADERPAGLYPAPQHSRQLAQAAPPATIDQRSLGKARPEAMQQCLQQALFWLGRYRGPVDGQASPAYIEALQTYASERGVELMSGNIAVPPP
jgi:hypothetical protein